MVGPAAFVRRMMVIGLLATTSHAKAAVPDMRFHLPVGRLITRIGQPVISSVRLHGVVKNVDAANRTVGLMHLSGPEYFWSAMASRCVLSRDLALDGIKPGQRVTVVVSHWRQGRCYVSDFAQIR